MWFPRPVSESDVFGIEAATSPRLSAVSLFALLASSEAVEWRDKVGVTNPADGSAKHTTRLLESGGWVFKTDTSRASELLEVAQERLHAARHGSALLQVSHPDKLWCILQAANQWWPLSATPRLSTLRSISDPHERFRRWTDMIALGMECAFRCGRTLDLNPANFGIQGETGDLFYLDDESYVDNPIRCAAEAIVARAPEHPDVSAAEWRAWGVQLQATLGRWLETLGQWVELLDGIRGYPLVGRLDPIRGAIQSGLSEGNQWLDPARRRRRRARQDARTCIFSDVHANLPALQAVLAEAQKLDVDGYLCLGDVVGYGPFPKQCIELVANLPNGLCIRGNHDHTVGHEVTAVEANRIARISQVWTQSQLDKADLRWLAELPVEVVSPPWMAVHGAPCDAKRFEAYVYELSYQHNLAYLAHVGMSLCFYGHTHVAFIHRMLEDGTMEKLQPGPVRLFQGSQRLLVNPGSVGQPRDGDPTAAFGIWHREEELVTFHRVAYDLSVMTRAIRSAGLPEDLANRLELGR